MTVNQEEQSKYLSFLQNQLSLLKEENHVLKRTIKVAQAFIAIQVPPEVTLDVLDDEPQSWAERSKAFASLRSQLIETAVWLIRLNNMAIHQDRILSTFQNRHREAYIKLRNPGETCMRRLREAAQEGWLTRPQDGWYYLGPKVLRKEEEIK